MLSSTEINSLKGMPYGGMPYSEITRKMEVTDLGSFEDEDGIYHDPRDAYNDYVRAEIIDRTPDLPNFDEDSFSRSPMRARKIINLHYGKANESPAHPEMFMGFTDPDPRGTSTDPRMDKLREQMAARARVKVQTMGENSDMQVGQRPWTGPSIEAGRMEAFKMARDRRIKVFSHQMQNDRPKGRTVSEIAQLARRHVNLVFGRGDPADEGEALQYGGNNLGDVVASRNQHMYEISDTGRDQSVRNPGIVNGIPDYFQSEPDHFVDAVADQNTRTNMAIVMKNAVDARHEVLNDAIVGEEFSGGGVPVGQMSPGDVLKIYRMSQNDTLAGESRTMDPRSQPFLTGNAPAQEYNQVLSNSDYNAISGGLIESSAGSKRAAQWLADFMTVMQTSRENPGTKKNIVYGDPTPVGKVEASIIDQGRATKIYGPKLPVWGAANGATLGKHEQQFVAAKHNPLYRQKITNWRSHTETSDPYYSDRKFGKVDAYTPKATGTILKKPKRMTDNSLSYSLDSAIF